MHLDRTYGRGDPVFQALQQALKGRDLLTDGREEGKNGRGVKPRAMHEGSADSYTFTDREGQEVTVRRRAQPHSMQCCSSRPHCL